MNYIFRCEKLVRDRIPELMDRQGHILHIETLNYEEHVMALKKKLLEEAHEVQDAQVRHEIIEEIADVLEVIDAMLEKLSISQDEIALAKQQKNINKGGFKDGLYLKKLTMPKDSPFAARFLQEPEKYSLLVSD